MEGESPPSAAAAPTMEPVEMAEDLMELSRMGKTIDGEGFAYLRLDCVGKNVGLVDIVERLVHLQEVNLSSNCIADVAPLATLAYALKLTLSGNQIESVDSWQASQLTHLLHLDLSGNRLAALPRLHLPALESASFARNGIATCKTFKGLPQLRALDISENRLLNLEGLCDCPMLERLDVSKNSVPAVVPEDEETQPEPARGVHSFVGLKALPALKTLDISKNIFETLEGPWSEMSSVTRLVVSENAISSLAGLKPLAQIKGLKELEINGNKLEEEVPNIRIEALICNPGLAVINGEPATPEERDEARETNETRIKEEEVARLAAEEAERERLAAEAEAEAERKAAEEEAARVAAEEAAAAAAAEAEAKAEAKAAAEAAAAAAEEAPADE